MATSQSPSRMLWAELMMACRPEPHSRLTVRAGVSWLQPPSMAATRAMYMSRGSVAITLPNTTWPTSLPEHLGARQHVLGHQGGQLGGGHVLQAAAEGADGGANGADDDDFSLAHGCLLVWGGGHVDRYRRGNLVRRSLHQPVCTSGNGTSMTLNATDPGWDRMGPCCPELSSFKLLPGPGFSQRCPVESSRLENFTHLTPRVVRFSGECSFLLWTNMAIPDSCHQARISGGSGGIAMRPA